ncbi:MAG: phosphatase PAP2 family protein [Candidatus Amulumruptor caecigallinarius]|nr:phosphatase PAP2 family protein [Candidatus Amulumruptor caecigallinarius]
MRKHFACIAAIFITLSAFSAWSQNDRTTQPDRYFLILSEVADSQTLLPPPPNDSTAHFAYDKEQYEWGKKQRPTERGRVAVTDANLNEGWLDRDFSDAFGFKLTPENAPKIYSLITNMKEDAGDLSTRAAKNHYMRPRPFMVFNEPSATPDDEPGLRKNGSFPSGHTAIGWATALVLSEINPARATEILKRGYDMGQSRVICGAHFQSDVDAGRIVGAGAVAALHANKNFQKKLNDAKKEFKKLQSKKK